LYPDNLDFFRWPITRRSHGESFNDVKDFLPADEFAKYSVFAV
jgi:hypothetical protein